MAHTEIAQAIPATPGQIKEVVRLFEDAFPSREQLEKLAAHCCSDKNSAQMLIERAGELKEVRKFFADLAKELSNSNLYADQVVDPPCCYFSGYRSARSVDEQIALLQRFDWGRPIDWSLNEQQKQLLAGRVPKGSEGYFVVPFDPTMVTDHDSHDWGNTDYGIPLNKVLGMLNEQMDGRLVNYCKDKLGPRCYRRSKQSSTKMRELYELQGSPTGIILIAAQLGIAYAGHSVNRARVVIRGQEFPLDAYETVVMFLTHENRLQHHEDLGIDCPGAEYAPDGDGVFNPMQQGCLTMAFCSGDIFFEAQDGDSASEYNASASAFLPVVSE